MMKKNENTEGLILEAAKGIFQSKGIAGRKDARNSK
jgi:hypothetical protein